MAHDSIKSTQLNEYLKHNLKSTKAKGYGGPFYRLWLTRVVTEFCLTAAFIYVGLNFLLLSQFSLNVWPAAGVGLTVLFLRGYSPIIAIGVGAFSAFYFHPFSWYFSLLQALGMTLYIYSLRALSIKWIGPIQPVNQCTQLFFFLLLSLVLTLSHIIYLYVLFFSFIGTSSLKFSHLLIHTFAEYNGIVCLTPLALMLDPYTIKNYFSKNKLNFTWWGCLFAILCLVIALGMHSGLKPNAVFMLTALSSITLIALFFGQIPASFFILLLAVCVLGGLFDSKALQNTAHPLWIIGLSGISSAGLLIACCCQKLNLLSMIRRRFSTA